MTQIVPPQHHHNEKYTLLLLPCSYLAHIYPAPALLPPCCSPAPTLSLPSSYPATYITIRRSSPPWARLVLGTPRGVRLRRQWASAPQCAEQEEERQEEEVANSKNNSVQHNTTDIRPLSTTYIEPLSTTEYHLVPLGTTSTAQYHLVSPTTTWYHFFFRPNRAPDRQRKERALG